MPETVKFRGTIQSTPIKQVPKLWEARHNTGAYTANDGHEYNSLVRLWVPTPRQGSHLPRCFIGLSNPTGSSFARLTSSELADLYTFIRTEFEPAQTAIAQAQALSDIYSEAERALFIASLELKNSPS